MRTPPPRSPWDPPRSTGSTRCPATTPLSSSRTGSPPRRQVSTTRDSLGARLSSRGRADEFSAVGASERVNPITVPVKETHVAALTAAAELAAKNPIRHPNETEEYRQARQELLVQEIELRREAERVASLRR